MARPLAAEHECFEKVSTLLRDRGEKLVTTVSLTGKSSKVCVLTERIEGLASRRRMPVLLAASFCPFCGRKL